MELLAESTADKPEEGNTAMRVALAVKPMEQLVQQYGPMRTVLRSDAPADLPREQADAYTYNFQGSKKLRESVITGADGKALLSIRCVEYIDPVTQRIRYGVDYWSIHRYWASDHRTRALSELSYEKAVRDELAHTTLTLPRERFTHGLHSFYDVTDVI
jgi:hypothetical protein